MQSLDPAIGDYLSFKRLKGGICVQTTKGSLDIPDNVLDLQFNNPNAVNTVALLEIISSYR
jgi:hypothetical protein